MVLKIDQYYGTHSAVVLGLLIQEPESSFKAHTGRVISHKPSALMVIELD